MGIEKDKERRSGEEAGWEPSPLLFAELVLGFLDWQIRPILLQYRQLFHLLQQGVSMRSALEFDMGEAAPDMVNVATLPRFKGQICFTMDSKGYGFIARGSITQIGGPKITLPNGDLRLHINENRGLSDPMPRGAWINFYVRSALQMRDGVLVFGAALVD